MCKLPVCWCILYLVPLKIPVLLWLHVVYSYSVLLCAILVQCHVISNLCILFCHVVVLLPDAPMLTIQHSTGSLSDDDTLYVTENEHLNLTCLVDAVPMVDVNSIEWTKDDVSVHTGPWLYQSNIQRLEETICGLTVSLTHSLTNSSRHS